MKYYGVTQSEYGHEYRWIYDEETLKEKFGEIWTDSCEDVGWPIGGSNSSATSIVLLENGEDAREFLTSPGKGPDLEDPTLVDIAEYMVSVVPEPDCCTNKFSKKFRLSLIDLVQYDDCYHRREKCEQMISEMLQYKDKLSELSSYEEIDESDPFYGKSKDLRYSILCKMYDEFLLKRAEWDIEKLENREIDR